jgi:hypothetical protein
MAIAAILVDTNVVSFIMKDAPEGGSSVGCTPFRLPGSVWQLLSVGSAPNGPIGTIRIQGRL